MASFMGLFRRWLDPSDEDNNNHQGQPTTSKDNQQQLIPNDGPKRRREVSEFQLETERDKLFQSAIEKLQAELRNSKGEVIALQRQHTDALAMKESEYQTLLKELGTQNDALNSRWMAERRKSERLEKACENQTTSQLQQIQMQRKSNARQLKELQETIVKQEIIVTNERAENLKLRNECQRAVDAREAESHRLSQQLIEVSRRLEDEVKVCGGEKKRREMAETVLESQRERTKQLVEQHKDTARQLKVVSESLEKQTKEREDERVGFHSMEKHYKETLTQKESDYGKLERCLATMTSTMQCRKKELNSEKKKIEALEQEISESKDQVLQVVRKHPQQLNILLEKVAQLTMEVENEKRKTTEVEKQRDEALTTNELTRQKFSKDLTQLNSRFESGSKALETEKQIRQALQMQLREQKEVECQKDRALEMEKKAKEELQLQLHAQKETECQKNRALEMEKKSKETLQIQLHVQKETECQKDIALEMEMKAREELQILLREQKDIECQRDRALEMGRKTVEALQIQLQKQKEIECQKNRALEMEKKAREALQIQLHVQKETECQKDIALEMEKKAREALQIQLQKQKEIECQKNIALEMEKKAREALQIQLHVQKETECKKDIALEMEKKAREELQILLREQKDIECQKNNALEMEKKTRETLQILLREQKDIECQKNRALEMEMKTREAFQIQLQKQKDIESQRDRALEMGRKTVEALQIQHQKKKEIECERDRDLEMEKKARESLQLQLQKQKDIECQKDIALEMEKKANEALQIVLKEKEKADRQPILYQLQSSLKQLSDYGAEILFLRKELETQRQKNVLSENDHYERVTRANADCQRLLATVAELQNRSENQAKNLLMERQKKEGLERQFQWQSEVLKHKECQLGITIKELDELKELFSLRGIELSNERLQKAYTDVDHLTVIAVKDKECKDLERQLTEARETLMSQTQLFANEKEKQEAAIKTFEDQLQRQIEMEKELKNQVMELEERLRSLQTPGAKDEEKDIEGENLSSVGTNESPPQRNYKEDDVLENQKLFLELSVLREKQEKATKELDMERQTRLDIQEQTKQLMAERDTLMEKAIEENEKLTSRITELEADKRSRAQTSDDQNDQPFKRDETKSNESLNVEANDTNICQTMEQEDNENNKTLSLSGADSLTKQSEQMEVHLTPRAKQLAEQIKRISELSEVKRKRLKLSTQGRHIQMPKQKSLLQPLQFVQQTIIEEQMPFQQNKQDLDPPTTRVDQDRRETLTASQDTDQSGSQVNWAIKNSTKKATIDAEAESEEEFTITSSRLNPLRWDENRIQKLRDTLKILQPPRDIVDTADTLPGIPDNETQDKQQQDFLTKIKEEPVTTKHEDNETEVDIHQAVDDDDENPPPKTKRRRIEEDSISTDVYYSAPYDRQTTGMVRVIEIKPETDIKQEPLKEQNVRTPTITDSTNGSKEPGSITKQEPKEEREQGIKQESKVVPAVINRKRLKAPSTSTYMYRSLLPKSSDNIVTDSMTNTSAANNIESRVLKDPDVHSSPEDARLVYTLRPQSLTTAVTGVAVLNGSLFIVSEMNPVVEVYDSTTFTFSGKVSVEGLTNPQSLTSCPLNACLYILDRTQPNNAIYRLGLAPDWRHHKWPIGTDFGTLASTSSGTLLLSCYDFRIKEFSSSGELTREFLLGQKTTSDLRLFGAVQLHRTSGTSQTAAETSTADEAQFVISYSHRRTGLRRVCTVDGKGQIADPLLKYKGQCTSQHLIVGHQSRALFLADFGMGEVFQWNAELKNCRKMVRRKDSGFRPLRICLDKNDQRIIIAEVCLHNDGSSTTSSGTNKLSVYDL